MPISIHIENVSAESKEALTNLGNYLLKVAGAPTIEALPVNAPVVSPMPHVPTPPTVLAAITRTPPPPPLPVIPEASIPQGVINPNLDVRGFPWDARIHSDAKTRNNDDSWRYRRGIKDDVIQAVETELRGVMGFPSAADAVQAPPAPPAPPAPTTGVPDGDGVITYTFDDLALYVTPLLAAKTITQAQVSDILRTVGTENNCDLSHLGKLMHRTDLIPTVRERIEALVEGVV